MKTIRLSGRERCVLRAIDFSTGTGGEVACRRWEDIGEPRGRTPAETGSRR